MFLKSSVKDGYLEKLVVVNCYIWDVKLSRALLFPTE